MESLEAEDKEDAQARIENIEELVSKIAAYEEQLRSRSRMKPSLEPVFWRRLLWWRISIQSG